ncbi:histone-lysine N-methyltransferase SMYD3 [Anthonomus grandis grandis]|uniref:histone-lysine N-methyltransferase SMYD3 n=1 Tax=Anthonomus grandis grandis TaxID=2921223 RepID=UPI00216628FF|nr:histone-lysine N-methyltransferase SMYD3 [Anthonomus grandis grandis]
MDIEATNSPDMPVKKEVVPCGTTVHQEKPFVYTLTSKFRTELCDFCFKKKAQALSKCSGCKYVYYCDRGCQKQGWAVHKSECKYLKLIVPRVLPDAARMLFRLIKRLENGGGSYKGYYGEKNYRMWRDLMSHYAELKDDKRRMEHMESLYEVLTEFFQGELLPNIVEFMGLYGRMCVNSFSICNQELQTLGSGIYIGASIIDHSCRPNAVATFEGTTLIIRTLEELPYLDWSKIKISYIDLMASTKERQKELLDSYYFLCDCPKCSEVENRAEMFGAMCPNCEAGVLIEEKQCSKCLKKLSKEFINEFESVLEFTEMHLASMKDTAYVDVCKVCLKKHHKLLYKHHLRHVKILDTAFESAIDLSNFDQALEYGLQLIENYHKYYPTIHPLTGLLHLKLCKLLLYKNQVKEGINHLKRAANILKITHGLGSSLYRNELVPLIQECRSMLGVK